MTEDIKQLINADLTLERENAALKRDEFAVWWAGALDKLIQRRKIEQIFFNDPDFVDKKHYAHMSHDEYYEYQLKKSVKFLIKYRKIFEEQIVKDFDANNPCDINTLYEWHKYSDGNLGQALFPQKSPLGLHHGMFIPAILNNANKEQQQEWLPKAWKMNGWIGTYAQTELGHGTYIRGLQTKAEFDIRNQQFILNSPVLSAYKWWPGGMGNTANKAIVIAPLFINGKPCGLQQFLVPLRDEMTHKPLPGVDIGEIGPKVGLNGANNGFLGFKNVRIPLNNMLMKHAQVLPSGRFVESPDPTLLYGTMMFLRVSIVRDAAMGLVLASTIATRYSIVRHQGTLLGSDRELKILDFVPQQAKIFTLVAKGIVFKLTAEKIWNLYREFTKQLSSGVLNNMPQMHALSCVLKAICTQECEEGVEILRKSCGGHGFLASSNFGQIYGSATAACTYEGENTVLLLQTARFLMKMVTKRESGEDLPDTASYLQRMSHNVSNINNQSTDLDLMTSLVQILEQTTTSLVDYAYSEQQKFTQRFGKSFGSNNAGIHLIKAAIAHGHCYLSRVALAETQTLHLALHEQSSPQSSVLVDVLSQMFELYIVDTFLNQLSNILLHNSHITANQVLYVEKRYEYLLDVLRPNIISVVDGFDFHDRTLNSTLGAWDGNVYENLMKEARKNPLNRQSMNATVHTYLKPLIHGKL